MRFSKWEALGNDFVLLDVPHLPSGDPSVLARRMCHRRTGVGADGLVWVTAEGAMRLFNADGSEAEVSGNALRCLAAYLVREGRIPQQAAISTRSGRRRVRVLGRRPWVVEVEMGRPRILCPELPAEPEEAVRLPAVALSLGNPHWVVFVKAVEEVAVERWGPVLERHPFFPERTNVEFTQVLSRDHLGMRVWERGVGVTPACGSGACAALAAAALTGRAGRRARVDLPGGILEVELDSGGRLRLRGPARELFRGEWIPDE